MKPGSSTKRQFVYAAPGFGKKLHTHRNFFFLLVS